MKMWQWLTWLVIIGLCRGQDAPSTNSLDSAGHLNGSQFPSVFSQAPTSSFDSAQQVRNSPTFGVSPDASSAPVAPVVPAALPAPVDQVALASAPANYPVNYQQADYIQQSTYADQVATASQQYASQPGYYYYYYPVQESIKKKDKSKTSLLDLLLDLPSTDLLHLPDYLSKSSDYEKVKSLGIVATALLITLGGLLLLMPMFNFNGKRSWSTDWINKDNLNTLADFVLRSIDSYQANQANATSQ